MRAIQISEQGSPGVLTVVTLPDPTPGPGQILIRVESASVNFSDVMRRRGSTYPFPTPLPFVPGGEVAGTVAALGDGVDGPPVETPVFALVGADGSGGYAELSIADARQVIPTPPGVTPDEAAGIVVAGISATLILTQSAELTKGQSVLVPAAAGGLGAYAIQIAKLLGGSPVVAAASTGDKRDAAIASGADHTVDSSSREWPAAVRELTGGAGVDVALEMTGAGQLEATLSALAPFGTAVVYGMASGTPGTLSSRAIDALLYDPALNQTVRAFNLGIWFGLRPQLAVAALQQLVEWVAKGQIKVPLGPTLPLDQAAEAHRRLEARETTGKIILKPQQCS